MTRLTTKIESGPASFTSRRAKKEPKIVRTPTKSGSSAATNPRKNSSESANRSGKAFVSARPMSSPTCSPIAGPARADPPRSTPGSPSSCSWRRSAASSISSSETSRKTAARSASSARATGSTRSRAAALSMLAWASTRAIRPTPARSPAACSSRSRTCSVSESGSTNGLPPFPSRPKPGAPNPTATKKKTAVIASVARARLLAFSASARSKLVRPPLEWHTTLDQVALELLAPLHDPRLDAEAVAPGDVGESVLGVVDEADAADLGQLRLVLCAHRADDPDRLLVAQRICEEELQQTLVAQFERELWIDQPLMERRLAGRGQRVDAARPVTARILGPAHQRLRLEALELRIDLARTGGPEEPGRGLDCALDLVPRPRAEPDHAQQKARGSC